MNGFNCARFPIVCECSHFPRGCSEARQAVLRGWSGSRRPEGVAPLPLSVGGVEEATAEVSDLEAAAIRPTVHGESYLAFSRVS
jgi:hypothetical protein